jgi:hypothetical protein
MVIYIIRDKGVFSSYFFFSYKNVASKIFLRVKYTLVPNDINDHGNEMKCDTQIKG